MAFKYDMHDIDNGDGSTIVAEINVTPLVDIMLVLLIIFMATSSVLSQMGIDVDLPRASPGLTQSQPSGVIITLLPQGAMRVNQNPVSAGDWNEFKLQLQTAFKKSQNRLVILEGDKNALLGMAIELMDHARMAGADNFAIAASAKD